MALDRIDIVESRVVALERQMEWMAQRLASLESWRVGKTYQAPPRAVRAEAPAPPPVIKPTERVEMPPPPNHTAPPSAPTPPEAEPRSKAPAEPRDMEYLIGARLLPRVGALLLLGAIVYLTYLGLQSGWITPTMVFVGEILFCVGFVAAGQWKRPEAEQYGQILTGVGSCGLYIALAGGHLGQHLYSGQVLVAAAMTLSFANLAYALWADSRAFLGIGILGGLATALLPTQENNIPVVAVLHLFIVLPAAFVAARKRWADMAGWLWLLSSVAMSPILVSDAGILLKNGTLFLGGAAAVAALVRGYRKNSFDPHCLLAPGMIFVTAAVGLGVCTVSLCAVYLLALGAVAWGISMLAVDTLCKERMQWVALAIPATLAPIAFGPATAAALFAGLSILAGVLSFAWKDRRAVAAMFAVVELGLALALYLVAQAAGKLTPANECALLIGMMAAAVLAAVSTSKVGGNKQVPALTAMALLLPLFDRLAILAMGGTAMAPNPRIASAEALAIFSIGAVVMALRTRWVSSVVAIWVSFGIALFGYTIAALDLMSPEHEIFLVGLLMTSLACALPISGAAVSTQASRAISFATGVLSGLLGIRLAFVVAYMAWPGCDPILVASLTAAGFSVVASGVSRWRKGGAALGVAWAMFAVSGFAYFYGGFQRPLVSSEMAILCGLLVAFLAVSGASAPVARKHPELWHALALLGWVVFSRWVDVSLTWGSADLHGFSTLTVAWIVYAVSLLAAGIVLQVRELRYWSFGVMFSTILKIIAVDLAYTSIAFRVLVLLGLGLVMLGGGYWYVKGKGAPAAG